ncbi:MAG: hypothetical protein O7G85_14850, partial [Planctomycetota bacterium]|nr:hypothetical protein [Planctomycetota bacterium]
MTGKELQMKLRWALPALIVSFMGLVSSVTAQTDSGKLSIAVITEKEVYIRSGNSDGHYPIGKAKQGEMVRVIAEKYEWAQVVTIGPVFDRFHGLIKYPDRMANRLEISADGKSARTLDRVDVIAPNPKVKPGESWKMIARLEANQTIEILESGKTQRGETLHKIVLPKTATVWIKKQHLRPATAHERAKWTQQLTGIAPVAKNTNQAIANNKPKPIEDSPTPAARVLARDTTPVDPITKPATNPQAARSDTNSQTSVTSNQPAEIVMQPDPERIQTPRQVKSPLPKPRKKAAELRLDELEAKYAMLQNEPIETAEIA